MEATNTRRKYLRIGDQKYKSDSKLASYTLILFVLLLSVNMIFANSDVVITGFEQFDDMYRYYSELDKPFVDDVMKGVNSVVFNITDFASQFTGTLLFLMTVITAAFAIWYAASPDFADEVSEVKQRVASGETIPIDEIKPFLLQFFPDIKANSGLSDAYGDDKPTLALFVRDHLLKFIILFAAAIMLRQNILVSFIVKSGNAIAYAGKYYTEQTDFVGIVNSWTTAGKDFKPGYDTLTREGKNKKKLFNSMYTAIKREYPRNRTEEFLQQVGIAVHNKVVELEKNSGLNLSAQNFSVSSEVVLSSLPYDNSSVNFRAEFNLSDFVTLGIGEQDRILHVNVLQYDIVEPDGSLNGVPSSYTMKDAWKFSNKSYPTTFDVGAHFSSYINDPNTPYVFKAENGAPQVTFKVTFSDGTTSEDIIQKGTITAKSYTIPMNNVIKVIDAKVNDTVSVRSITVTGFNQGVRLVNESKSLTQPIPSSAVWRR